MQAAFPFVMIGAIVLFVLLGVLSMLTRNNLYDQIGQGGLSIGEEQLRGLRDSGGAGAAEALADQSFEGRDEREQEIRQMLQARSDRLVNQGHEPLDIDAELARLDPPGVGGVGGIARQRPRRSRSASWSSPATNAASARASPRSTSTPRSRARSPSSKPEPQPHARRPRRLDPELARRATPNSTERRHDAATAAREAVFLRRAHAPHAPACKAPCSLATPRS